MFPGIHTAPLRVADLFSDPFRFKVPAYQRRFSWTVKEAAQLLDDIVMALGPHQEEPVEPDYFLGAILLTDPEGVSEWNNGPFREPRTLDIVDGQQRLTTLTILLAALRDVSSAEGDGIEDSLDALIVAPGGRGFRLQLRRGDDNFLIDYALAYGACNATAQSHDLEAGAQAIIDVRDHFVRELSAMSPDERRRLFTFVLQSCHVVAIVTSDLDRGHRLFSVLNDRGRPLARKDILKAEILGGVAPERAAAVEAAWDEIDQRLGGEFDSFFSYLRMIKGKGKLPIIAGIRAVKEEVGGSEPFVFDVLLPLADAYDVICRIGHQGALQSAEINRRLRYLSWLGSSEWVPATIHWLNISRNNPQQALRFLEVIEPFAYSLRLQCIGASKRATRSSGLLSAIARGTVLDPERSPCVLSRDEQRHITANLRNLHERHPQTCKLVLLRLNDELAGSPQELNPGDWTVEHVLPQNSGRSSQWRTWFPEADERERLAQSIGNLVLVRRTQNDKASNQDFARKKAIFFRSGEADQPVLTQEIREIEVWTPAEIKTREARFLRILEEIWRLDLSAVAASDGEPRSSGRRQASASKLTGTSERRQVTEV